MNTYNLITFADKLEDYVSSWKQQLLIFSYKITCSWTQGGLLLVLAQEETDVSTTLLVRREHGRISITSLSLFENEVLKDICISLHDAALLEILFQSLILVYHLGETLATEEIIFLLIKKEADHLMHFQYLFEEVSFPLTGEGKRILLRLPTTSLHYQEFRKEVTDLKSKLHQKMWVEQRAEPFIKNYLQNRILPPIPSRYLDEKTHRLNQSKNNIILLSNYKVSA